MTEKEKYLNLSAEQIEKSIYGENGLYDRVLAKIEKISVRKASSLTGRTTQNIYGFMNKENKSRENKSRPKLETIVYFGEKLGVE